MRRLGPRIRFRTGAKPSTRRPRTCARSSRNWPFEPRPRRVPSTRSPRRSTSAESRSALALALALARALALALELAVERAQQALASLVAPLVVPDLAELRRAEFR